MWGSAMGCVRVDNMEQAMEVERQRVKLLKIAPQLLLSGVIGAWQEAGELVTWQCANVPRDVKVESVWYDPECNSFCFRLWHHSFDPVPAGHMAPIIMAEVQQRRVKLPEPDFTKVIEQAVGDKPSGRMFL